MKLLTRTGIGTADHTESILDNTGKGMLPIQAAVTGTATFRVLGRVHPDAPWVEVIASGTVAFLQAISWVPYIRLDVTAGTGTVTVYIGDE